MHQEFNDTERPPGYRQKLITLFEQRNIEIPAETIDICSSQLETLRDKYHDYAYHNDIHSFDDIPRAFRILDTVSRYVDVTPKDYELLTIAGAYHDDTIVGDTGTGMTAEQISAHRAVMATGLDSSESQKLTKLVMVTEVMYDHQGVHQINLLDDDKDILRFALGFADIGATIMEGKDRMIQDIVNLTLEKYNSTSNHGQRTTLDTMVAFIEMQQGFVDERLRDLSAGIEYYFGQYGDTIVEQIAADLYSQFSETAQEIQHLLQQFDAQLPLIRHRLQREMSTNELRGEGDCSASIQQKLKTILDDMQL